MTPTYTSTQIYTQTHVCVVHTLKHTVAYTHIGLLTCVYSHIFLG